MYPKFPDFQPIKLEDRAIFNEFLSRYQPENSELTFTNLFIWRSHFGTEWCIYRNWLLIICTSNPRSTYALPPIGPPSRLWAIRALFKWLGEENRARVPRIERADERLVSEVQDMPEILIEPTRDHFDYVYRSEDLIKLTGKPYMVKRQQTNKFRNTYNFKYAPLDDSHIDRCLELSALWCERKRCDEDQDLLDEGEAIIEALTHYYELGLRGGVIMVNGSLEAFAIGEMLNEKTAVVHLEKANYEIPGIYSMINQQFSENQWKSVPFVNREQDLGVQGLRQAKLSYHPIKLTEKFRIRMNRN